MLRNHRDMRKNRVFVKYEVDIDQYGNTLEKSPHKLLFTTNIFLLSRLLLLTLIKFLSVKELLTLNLLNKRFRFVFKEIPLRLDYLEKIVDPKYVTTIEKKIKFSDGTVTARWMVTGILADRSPTKIFSYVNAANLVRLGIRSNQFTTLKNISSKCINLQRLELLHCTEVISLYGISNLKNLESLIVIGTPKLNSIDGIDELKRLRVLHLQGCTSLKQIEPVSSATTLQKLYIHTCNVTDFSPITKLIFLERISFEHCPKLTNLNFLPKNRNIKRLDISTCTNLVNVSWLKENCDTMADIIIQNCPKLLSLPTLERAHFLVNLVIRNSSVTHLPCVKNSLKLNYLNLEECKLICNFQKSISKLLKLEKIVLNECTSLTVEDANIFLSCKSLFLFEVKNCPCSFLAALFKTDNILITASVKLALRKRFLEQPYNKINSGEALSFINSFLDINDKDEALVIKHLVSIKSLINEFPPLAHGVVNSKYLLTIILGKILSAQTITKGIQCRIDFMVKLIEVEILTVQVIDSSMFKDLLGNINLKSEDMVMSSLDLCAEFLHAIKLNLFIENEYASNKNSKNQSRVKWKLDPLVLLSLLSESLTVIEESHILNYALEKLKFSSSVEVSDSIIHFFRWYFEMTKILNNIVELRSNLRKRATKNKNVVLEKIEVDNSLVETLLPISYKIAQEKESSLSLNAVTLFILLLQLNKTLGQSTLLANVIQTEHLVGKIYSHALKSLAVARNNVRLKEETKLTINIGNILVNNLPTSCMMNLLQGEPKSLKLIITLLETNRELLQACIKEENNPVNFKCIEDQDKKSFIFYINELISTLVPFAASEKLLNKSFELAENLPGVIASLIHTASDQLEVFDSSLNVILLMCKTSPVFCAKVQYLYSNSNIVIALKLFINSKADQRPRIVKSFQQKKLGLRLLLVLSESNTFCTKFLDHTGEEMINFVNQFNRFVCQESKSRFFQEFEAIKCSARFIAILATTETNTESKIKILLANFLLPLCKILRKLTSEKSRQRKFKEIRDAEKAHIAEEERLSKPKNDRDNTKNPLEFILTFTGLVVPNRQTTYQDNAQKMSRFLFSEPIVDNKENSEDPQWVSEGNWMFRIIYFLASFFGYKNTYIAFEILSEDTVESLFWCLSYKKRVKYKNENEWNVCYLVEAGAMLLLSRVIDLTISLQGKKTINVKGLVAQKPRRQVKTTPIEPTRSETNPLQMISRIFGNNAGDLFLNRRAEAAKEVEQQNKARAAMVRLLLNKKRQIDHVNKVAHRLKTRPDSFGTTKTNEVKPFQMSKRQRIFLKSLYHNVMSQTKNLSDVIYVLENGPIQIYTVSSFLLFSSMLFLSNFQNEKLLPILIKKHVNLISILQLKCIAVIGQEEVAVRFAYRLLENDDLSFYHFFKGFIDQATLKTTSNSRRNKILSYLVQLVAGDSAKAVSLKLILQAKNDSSWEVPAKLGSYIAQSELPFTATSIHTIEKILTVLNIFILSPLSLLKVSRKDAFFKIFVNLLFIKEDFMPCAKHVLRILSGIIELDYTTDEAKLLGKLLLRNGLLDALNNWKSGDSFKALKETSDYHLKLGATAISVALDSGELLDAKTFAGVQKILLDWLFDENRFSKSVPAKILIKLDGKYLHDQDFAEKDFQEYDTFCDAVKLKEYTKTLFLEENDIILEQTRGLPQTLRIMQNYTVEFKSTLSTVNLANNPKLFNEYAVYIEIEVLEAKSFANRQSVLTLGVFDETFLKGYLAGTFLYGVGNSPGSCGTVLTSFQSRDVLGLLIFRRSKQLQIYMNGKEYGREDVTLNMNTIYPAITGKNITLNINLGQRPFCFNKPKWKSYLECSRI